MTPFEYITVIVSVVLGLGITHILGAITSMIRARRRVRFSWNHAAWLLLAFLGQLFLWWSIWSLRYIEVWNFFSFLLLLMQPISLFVATSFLLPDSIQLEGDVDLDDIMDEASRPYFLTLATAPLIIYAYNCVISGGLVGGPGTLFLFFSFVITVAAALTRNRRFQLGLAIAFLIALIGFVTTYAGSLRST
ncbi:MAG TPA: hypothetical protein VM100_09990 [Longimicrobiales bacterium]|nr:hypothetical protein [Longimicrobiales bacterium]